MTTPSHSSPGIPTLRFAKSKILALWILIGCSQASADHGNTYETASPITPGTLNASLTTGDEDWFSFSIGSNGQIALYSQGLTNTYARLYDAAGTYLGIADDSGGTGVNFSIERQMSPGTYYLRVTPGFTGALTGAYSLTLRTQESAPFVIDSSFSGSLSLGQIDFYRIELESQGLFEIYTTGLTNTYGRLFDAAGTYLGIADDSGGANQNFHIELPSHQPGVYLLKVTAGFSGALSGSYQGFVLRPALAETIGSGTYSRSLTPLGDVDHFRFQVERYGHVRIHTTGTTNTYGQLFDSVGVYAGISNDSSGEGSNFLISASLDPGTYFLRVSAGFSGSLSGAYLLHVELPGDTSPTAALRAKLLKQLALAKRQLARAKKPTIKRRLKRQVAVIQARLAKL